jgi:hypothetical protein
MTFVKFCPMRDIEIWGTRPALNAGGERTQSAGEGLYWRVGLIRAEPGDAK